MKAFRYRRVARVLLSAAPASRRPPASRRRAAGPPAQPSCRRVRRRRRRSRGREGRLVNLQQIAQLSVDGKAADRKVQALITEEADRGARRRPRRCRTTSTKLQTERRRS